MKSYAADLCYDVFLELLSEYLNCLLTSFPRTIPTPITAHHMSLYPLFAFLYYGQSALSYHLLVAYIVTPLLCTHILSQYAQSTRFHTTKRQRFSSCGNMLLVFLMTALGLDVLSDTRPLRTVSLSVTDISCILS